MSSYAFGPFVLDVSERRLLREGQTIPLTPRAFDVLCVLVERSGHLVTKELLLQQVWPSTFVDEANINRCVSVLRKALGDTAGGSEYIQTVPKSGYRFVVPVEQVLPAATADAAERVAVAPPVLAAVPPLPGSRRWLHNGRGAIIVGAVLVTLLVAAVVYLAVRQRQASRAAGTAAAPIHRQATFGGREGTPAISPDGRRIAYVATDTNRRRIVVQDLPDGRAATLLTTTEAGNLRWSPDGSQILFTGRDDDPGGLYVLSRLGGGARRVFSGQFVACWSPDGKTIAVAQYGAGRIVFVDSAGRPAGGVTLARVERWISDLDWSPATNRLLVVANDLRGRHTIWTIGRDGNDQREIVSEPGEIESARWAPNGRAIYYFRRVGQTVSLVSAPVLPGAGGTTQSVLLTGLETDGGFSISSDGERLVYARSPYFSNLHLVDLSESAARGSIVARQITNGTSLVERPRVSPDGTQILFNAGHQPLANLYVMPIAGGEPRQLTFFRAFSVGGVWSPDGKSVAFASTQGGTPRVWMMSADGDNPHPISSGDLSDSYEVLWAPAPRILYQQAGNRNYYVLDPPTGREQPLMSDASLGWVFTPTYSPDLTKLAFAWSRRSQFGLWIADTRTTTQKLAYGASIPTPLGWSPDGAWVYAFEGTRAAYRGLSTALGETMTQVRVMRLSEDGRVETVFALPFEEVGGIAMSRDGRVLVCVVYSSRSDVWVVEHFDAAHSPA